MCISGENKRIIHCFITVFKSSKHDLGEVICDIAAFNYPAQIWMSLAAISRLTNVGHKYTLIKKDNAIKHLHTSMKGIY